MREGGEEREGEREGGWYELTSLTTLLHTDVNCTIIMIIRCQLLPKMIPEGNA